uniref:MIA SH3 domain ER export factor 2 n=1 Tax=Cynoglossus semilaevis TaxID=244447 RepID=A0A3P8U9T8_CYNSE
SLSLSLTPRPSLSLSLKEEVHDLYRLFSQVVSSLPDDIRPGPDLYGLPWEPVILTCLVGLVTVVLFTCRCYSSVSTQYTVHSTQYTVLLCGSTAAPEPQPFSSLCFLTAQKQNSLTDCLLRVKDWDSNLAAEDGDKEAANGRGESTDTDGHFQNLQKLIHAAKLNADLKSVDEDKTRVFAKLNDEVKAKEDLEGESSLTGLPRWETKVTAENVERLQQKLQIMTEMYQENELKLHRLLTVEEKERLQKEEKLHKADKNIALAMEELNNYRQRAGEMEEELDKTKQSYQTQISAHEKKAHNNWLAARAAERELSDIKRENSLLRQKFYLVMKSPGQTSSSDVSDLNSLCEGERSPYGPSPLGRPASETRAFLSPPTLMDGPPTRLSPRGESDPTDSLWSPHECAVWLLVQLLSDCQVAPESWSAAEVHIQRACEYEVLNPNVFLPALFSGYMFPEPGGPMYRRPPPPPGVLGPFPPPGPPPPHLRGFPPPGPPRPPHPADLTGELVGSVDQRSSVNEKVKVISQ